MDRCVKSGLWVADASTLAKDDEEGKESGATAGTEAEKENPTAEEDKLTSEFKKQDLADTKHEEASKATDAAKGDQGV